MFTTPGCGACRHLRALLTPLADELGLPLYEVDAGREGALVHAMEVFHLPALFLYQQGQFHAEISAEPRALRGAIEAAARGPAQEEP